MLMQSISASVPQLLACGLVIPEHLSFCPSASGLWPCHSRASQLLSLSFWLVDLFFQSISASVPQLLVCGLVIPEHLSFCPSASGLWTCSSRASQLLSLSFWFVALKDSRASQLLSLSFWLVDLFFQSISASVPQLLACGLVLPEHLSFCPSASGLWPCYSRASQLLSLSFWFVALLFQSISASVPQLLVCGLVIPEHLSFCPSASGLWTCSSRASQLLSLSFWLVDLFFQSISASVPQK
uniref:Uncharacterized protein n=1 Tax=Sphaerodactylus townsendi TaxID=933632 RepID=A0ACB8GFG9_9SAUR